MVETALIVSAVAAVAGTGYSIYSGMKARDAQEEAAETRNKQIALQNRQRRRSQVRQARIARAQAANAAAQTGAGESSGIAGGVSSLSSQVGSNLGFTSQQGALSDQFSRYQQEAADWMGQSSIGGAVAGLGRLGMGVAQAGGASFSGLFDSGGAQQPTPAATPQMNSSGRFDDLY